MSYYKIEKQKLEQNLNDVLKTSSTTSSQTIAKPLVVGSVSLSANVPKHFAEAVKKLHEKHNVKLMTYQDYKNDWISVVVIGSMDDLKKLNIECEDVAYSAVV